MASKVVGLLALVAVVRGSPPVGLCSVPVDEVSPRLFRGDALSVDVLLYAPAPRRLPDRGSAGARAARKLVQLESGASDAPAAIEEEVASPAVSLLQGDASVTAGPGGPVVTVAALATSGSSAGPAPISCTVTSSGSTGFLPADDSPPSPDAPSPAGTIDPGRIRHEAEAQTPLAEAAAAASAAALAAAGARDSARADFGTARIRHETEANTPLAEAAAASASPEGGPRQQQQQQQPPQPQSQSTNRLRRSVQRVSAPASALTPLSASARASLELLQQQAGGHPEWRAFVDSLGAPPPSPASAHVVFFNGLGCSPYDTRLLRSHLKTAHPHLLCYSTTASQASRGERVMLLRYIPNLCCPCCCRAARRRAISSRRRCASHARSRGSLPSRCGGGGGERATGRAAPRGQGGGWKG